MPRNASYYALMRLTSGQFHLVVLNADDKVMARFKVPATDLMEVGRDISFVGSPYRDDVSKGGTISVVRFEDDAGTVLVEGIPFSEDNSQPFRFRHEAGIPDSLTFQVGEVMRWTKGTLVCHQMKVIYGTCVLWQWEG